MQLDFDILENQQHFPVAGVICALDAIIHQMHLGAGNKGLLREGVAFDVQGLWSKEVKEFVDLRRRGENPVRELGDCLIDSLARFES